LEVAWEKLFAIQSHTVEKDNAPLIQTTIEYPSHHQPVFANLVHDLKNAVMSFRGAVEALERGYRFDDATASARIRSLRAGTEAAQKASQLIDAILNAEQQP
jgi:hypothetical protein